MKRMLLGLLCLFMTQQAFAAGFALYEGSARGNALSGLTGSADDAAAIYFNPAGMTQLEGTHFMGGATLIAPYADIQINDVYSNSTSKTEFEDNIFTPPHIFITHQLNEKMWVGGGVYTRFGLGTEYDPDWVGRYSNIETVIQTISYGANFAYKVNDNLSLGVGISGMWLDAVLKQSIDANRFQLNPPNDPSTYEYDAVQEISGDNVSWGFDLSAHYHSEKWSFGLMYISSVEHDLEGVAEYDKPDSPVPFTWFNDTNVSAETIELPEMIFSGATYKMSEKTNINFTLIRTGWSSLKSLIFNYDNPFAILPGLGATLDRAERELNWEDVWRWGFGVEHKFRDNLTLMGGYTLDESPLSDETTSYLLPTNDRNLINTGLSLQREKWLLTLSYTYIWMKDRHISDRQISEGVNEGLSEGTAHLVGFSASRRF